MMVKNRTLSVCYSWSDGEYDKWIEESPEDLILDLKMILKEKDVIDIQIKKTSNRVMKQYEEVIADYGK